MRETEVGNVESGRTQDNMATSKRDTFQFYLKNYLKLKT